MATTVARMADLRNEIAWLEDNSFTWFVVKPGTILAIFLGAFILRWIVHRAINRLVNRLVAGQPPAFLMSARHNVFRESRNAGAARREQRALTIGSLLRSLASGLIIGIAALMALDLVGLPIGPLLASAGVLGLAVGFGAQSLIRDLFAGLFMIAEDQYGVGDWVDLGEAMGTVEAVGLRITRLRDLDGTVWYVRNGEILRVGNGSQNWSRAVLDVPITYDTDVERAQRLLHEIAEELCADPQYRDFMIGAPEIWGVQAWQLEAMLIRVVMKTLPGEHWGITRELRRRVIDRFATEEITLPHVPPSNLGIRPEGTMDL